MYILRHPHRKRAATATLNVIEEGEEEGETNLSVVAVSDPVHKKRSIWCKWDYLVSTLREILMRAPIPYRILV